LLAEVRRIAYQERFLLLPFLSDSNPECRACVAKAYKYIGANDDEIVASLRQALECETDEWARQELAAALSGVTML
jgi:hypothetical protein